MLHSLMPRALCLIITAVAASGEVTSFAIGPAGLPALSADASLSSQAAFQPDGLDGSRSSGLGMVLKVDPNEVYLRMLLSIG
jgi:hypothetical protein